MNKSQCSSLLLLTAILIAGCKSQENPLDTYPCTMVVYSHFDSDVIISECEGIGNVYPHGIIKRNSNRSPSAVFIFPRQSYYPKRLTIKWRKRAQGEKISDHRSAELSQELEVPQIEKGIDGELQFELSQDNVWSLKFVPKKLTQGN